MKKSINVPILVFIFIASCRLSYQPQSVQYTDYRINNPDKTDTSFAAFLKPYGDSVHKRMQVVVATAAITLQKSNLKAHWVIF